MCENQARRKLHAGRPVELQVDYLDIEDVEARVHLAAETGKRSAPTGQRLSAQGCREAATLGNRSRERIDPNGVAALVKIQMPFAEGAGTPSGFIVRRSSGPG